MLDIALNAIRLALSDDARRSTSALLDLLNRKAEWQRDICTIDARVSLDHREQASLLSGICIAKLERLKFDAKALGAFKTTFLELSSNAFEHGCVKETDVVEFIFDLTESYVALQVINPKGRKVLLDLHVRERSAALELNPHSDRGRGLLLVSELADVLEPVAKDTGLKAVIYQDRVAISVSEEDSITILTIDSGIHNPSFSRRLTRVALGFRRNKLVIDLRKFGYEAGTRSFTIVLHLAEICKTFGGRVIAWFPPDPDCYVALPEVAKAFSWDEITRKLA